MGSEKVRRDRATKQQQSQKGGHSDKRQRKLLRNWMGQMRCWTQKRDWFIHSLIQERFLDSHSHLMEQMWTNSDLVALTFRRQDEKTTASCNASCPSVTINSVWKNKGSEALEWRRGNQRKECLTQRLECRCSCTKRVMELVQFRSVGSVAQSCPTLCDPMDSSTSGLPVHHQLPESTQTHVHWVGDAIQPSHPLSSPSPPALNLSQHQGLFQWVNSSHQVAKVLEFQL